MKLLLRGEVVTEVPAYTIPEGQIVIDAILIEEHDTIALSDKLEGFYSAEYFRKLSVLFLPVPNI